MTSKIELKALTLLRSIELTRDMENEHLKKLATTASEVTFGENEIIYEKGNIGKALYLIEEGEVVIEADLPGQPRAVLNRLGPGQFFGWSSLFPLERKMAWTRTVKPTRVFAFDASKVRNAFEMDHNLEYALIRRGGKDMVARIKATRQRLTEMLTSPRSTM